MKKTFLTHLVAKAELVERNSDQFKTIAATVQEKYGFKLQPQIDLMYVRSCLVTSGMNANDDVFLRNEMWNARHTPVMKPANWQHKDKDIVGVVYSIEARDLNGNVLDFNKDTPPDTPYEYWTEAVVFKLIHGDRAAEIEERAAKGNLFVSMEAWFDDYDYALVRDNEPAKIIARNDNTTFLDSYLRSNGGGGKYESVRIGRALKNITFGGFGFVDVPANKRSVIDSVISTIEPEGVATVTQETDGELEKLIHSLFTNDEQEIDMNKVTASDASTDGSKAVVDPDALAKAVADALEAREAAKAAAKAEELAKATAAQLEKTAAENAAKVVTLEGTVKDAETKATAAANLLAAHASALEEVIKALAGATSDTPPEIAAVDAAIAVKGDGAGDAVFNARIAWIKNSVANRVAPMAKKLAGLEKDVAEAAAVLREQEVTALLKDHLTEAEVKAMVAVAAKKNDAEYAEWLSEKELFVERIKGAKAPPFAKKDEKADKKEDAKDDCSKAGMTAAINELVKLRKGANAEVNSGVGSGALKNPRFKIAGQESAEEVLEGAKPEEKPELSAAKGGEDGKEENPFRSLAKSLVGAGDTKETKRPAKAKASFDPVE
jgi:hypothetical protein